MDIVFLFFSALCFISAWGIHIIAKADAAENCLLYCGYMAVPWLCAIPWLSGFVLAVVPEVFMCDLAWYWMFLINIPVTLVFGKFAAAFILRRFSAGKGAGMDIIISIVIGGVSLGIGMLIQQLA